MPVFRSNVSSHPFPLRSLLPQDLDIRPSLDFTHLIMMSSSAKQAAAEKKLKPKRAWKDLYEARKLKREEKARAAAASSTVFSNLTVNYAAHKLVGRQRDE